MKKILSWAYKNKITVLIRLVNEIYQVEFNARMITSSNENGMETSRVVGRGESPEKAFQDLNKKSTRHKFIFNKYITETF